ncbi:MAG TPA: hypothetical protein VK955_14100, partial [Xanthobacteraceae bacterium]|nr:hypothetical protein [Xanthobacteraceae bacterium]
MTVLVTKRRLLSGAAVGFVMALSAPQAAYADSVCSFGVNPPGGFGTDCTDPNGNGHSDYFFTGGASEQIGATNAVLFYQQGGTSAVTTGYIESTTAGRGVLAFDVTNPFTYTGTGSTLVGQAGATNATILNIIAPNITINTGTITSLGAGSTALSLTANGGAGAGGINVTMDGNISSAGPGIVLTSTNAAANQAISLTQNAGTTLTAVGNAVDVHSAGTGTVNLDLSAGTIAGGNIAVTTTGSSGSITVNAGAGAGAANITVSSGSVSGLTGISAHTGGTGTVTVTAGAVTATAGNGIDAASTTGNIVVNANGNIGAAGLGFDGIHAVSTSGTIQVNVTGGNVVPTGTAGDGVDLTTSAAKTVTIAAGRSVAPTGGVSFAIFGN